MASVASIDPPAASDSAALRRAEAAPLRESEYLVPDSVRVRQESFGLLFYDTRSTRLTFVRSGDSLVPPLFTGPRRVLGVRTLAEGRQPALSRLLQNLVAKGLIVAAGTST
jgi:putative mycofactocin binding protein MftB